MALVNHHENDFKGMNQEIYEVNIKECVHDSIQNDMQPEFT